MPKDSFDVHLSCGRSTKERSSIHGTDNASHIWCICFVQNWTTFLTQCSIGDNTQLDVIMAVNSDDFMCLSDEDALNHSDTLCQIKCRARDMRTLGLDFFKEVMWMQREETDREYR